MRHRGPELDTASKPRNLARRLVGGKQLTGRVSADAAQAVPRLIVPAYFHPASHRQEWEWLAQRAARIRFVILNVANGPGGQPDEGVFPALALLRAAGIAVCGYVDTNYGQRAADEVIADLYRHLRWYRVDGVFFDRAAIAAQQVSHYADLARWARDGGARLVAFNHGAHPIEPYADHADLLGTFEGPWTAYLELGVPRWVRSRPAGQFFHLLYAVPTASFADALWLAAHRHAGCAYVTDRDGVNPWDGLPAGELDLKSLLSAATGRPPGQACPAAAGQPGSPAADQRAAVRRGRDRGARGCRARAILPAGAHPRLLLPGRHLDRGDRQQAAAPAHDPRHHAIGCGQFAKRRLSGGRPARPRGRNHSRRLLRHELRAAPGRRGRGGCQALQVVVRSDRHFPGRRLHQHRRPSLLHAAVRLHTRVGSWFAGHTEPRRLSRRAIHVDRRHRPGLRGQLRAIPDASSARLGRRLSRGEIRSRHLWRRELTPGRRGQHGAATASRLCVRNLRYRGESVPRSS
jgi:hypothetical protein